ncbi:uncharacterized protein [Diadema antillarum]|uniref:uncharacterized protein n=1 Tax=Diadema antillarum TaxID=105358 RepID=UPI003A8AEA30
MAAPPKPWERQGHLRNNTGLPFDQDAFSQHVNQQSTTAWSNASSRGMSRPTGAVRRAPPPLPSRTSQQGSLMSSSPLNRYGYGGMGLGSYGGTGYGTYGGMYGGLGGMYSGYGGSMYGGYGRPMGLGDTNDTYSRFVQQAEESSRPAFQSIESIVQAFASVSMMLESTFHTVYNSFRAVLGVAEHFSRLKIHLAKIFSALALFRLLKYVYRRLLVLLRLRTPEFAEEVWKEAESQAAEGTLALLPKGRQHKAPSWPIFMFFAVVVGGPYIIWKLLSSSEDEAEVPAWASGDEDHVVARAEYDFDRDSEKELSFHSGDILNLAPKELQPRVRGWLLASLQGEKIGLVPANYIKILGKRKGQRHTESEQQQVNALKLTQSGKSAVPTHRPNTREPRGAVQRPDGESSAMGLSPALSGGFQEDFLSSADTAGAGNAVSTQLPASTELEADFVFNDDSVKDSNSLTRDEKQGDFVGFDDDYWPSSNMKNKEKG